MTVRDVSQLLYPAVQQAIAELGLLGSDAAGVKLAQQYARTIDSQPGHCRGCDDEECSRAQTSAWAMRWLGPLLHALLNDLGATPAGRAAITKGKPGGKEPEKAKSQLDQLRDARSKRRA